MKKIEIYTKSYCPYCTQAKELMDGKGVKYTEFDVTDDEKMQKEMLERAGGALHTVPQIYIDDKLIGGYSDLQLLEDAGDLDRLLAGH